MGFLTFRPCAVAASGATICLHRDESERSSRILTLGESVHSSLNLEHNFVQRK